MPTIAELERYATVLRIDCVRMLAVAKSGHLDSSLSAADIVAALYYRVLRHDPERPQLARAATASCSARATPRRSSTRRWPGTATSRYEDLMGLRKLDAHLQGHPDMTRTPGRRGLDRLARPGSLDVPRASRSACASTGSTRRTSSR